MFCRNCGKELNGKFCPECGTQAEVVTIQENITSKTQEKSPQKNRIPVMPQKKRQERKTWVTIAIVLFSVAIIFTVMGTPSNVALGVTCLSGTLIYLAFAIINKVKCKPVKALFIGAATCLILTAGVIAADLESETDASAGVTAGAQKHNKASSAQPTDNDFTAGLKDSFDNSSSEKSTVIVEHENIKGEMPYIDTSTVGQLQEQGFKIEEATEIQSIFLQIGVNSVADIRPAAGQGIDVLQSFIAIANGNKDQKFYFTVEQRKIFFAGFRDADLYDTEQGGVLKSIGDVHIPETAIDSSSETTLRIAAEDEVLACLTYPSSAKFSVFGCYVGRSDEKYKVTGTVTTENGFGVKEKISYEVWFTGEANKFTVDAVALGGTRIK